MAPVSLIFFSVPVSSWASAGPAPKQMATRIESNILRCIAVSTCERAMIVAVLQYPSEASCVSVPDLDVPSGCILDRYDVPAAGLARRDFSRILCLDPVEPVGPPGAGVFLRLFEPGVEAGVGRLRAGPILVFHLRRRIDDAGDVAGAGQHEAHWPAEELRAEQHRLGGSDVILARGEIVDRDLHALELELLAADHHVALGQPVLEVAVAQ